MSQKKKGSQRGYTRNVSWICLFNGHLYRGGHPNVKVANYNSEIESRCKNNSVGVAQMVAPKVSSKEQMVRIH